MLGKAFSLLVNVVTFPVSCLIPGHFAVLCHVRVLFLGDPTVYPVAVFALGAKSERRVVSRIKCADLVISTVSRNAVKFVRWIEILGSDLVAGHLFPLTFHLARVEAKGVQRLVEQVKLEAVGLDTRHESPAVWVFPGVALSVHERVDACSTGMCVGNLLS